MKITIEIPDSLIDSLTADLCAAIGYWGEVIGVGGSTPEDSDLFRVDRLRVCEWTEVGIPVHTVERKALARAVVTRALQLLEREQDRDETDCVVQLATLGEIKYG